LPPSFHKQAQGPQSQSQRSFIQLQSELLNFVLFSGPGMWTAAIIQG